MTDVNGLVTAAAPDPNVGPGKAPSSTTTGTDGERSASLTAAQRRAAGLLNDGDTIIPQVPHNDGLEGGRPTRVRDRDGAETNGPRRTVNQQEEAGREANADAVRQSDGSESKSSDTKSDSK